MYPSGPSADTPILGQSRIGAWIAKVARLPALSSTAETNLRTYVR
jgi:hypothetical protein